MSDAALHAQLLDRLVDIRRQIEAHHTAVFVLEQERLQVREQLIRLGTTAGQESQP